GGKNPLQAEATAPPFEWEIKDAELGDHLVKVVAYQGDTMHQTGEASIAIHVAVQKPCGSNDDCPGGLCVGGLCQIPREPSPGGCGCALGGSPRAPGL